MEIFKEREIYIYKYIIIYILSYRFFVKKATKIIIIIIFFVPSLIL